MPFHLANLLLYGLVCLAVYRLARSLLGSVGGWWAAALFAVHPVHVEAVANSVGQSELWAALAVVSAVGYYVGVRRRRAIEASDVAAVTAMYVAGCLFKEHAIVLPALLFAAEVTVLGSTAGALVRRSDARLLYMALGLSAALYLGVHSHVVSTLTGDRPNIAFRGMSYGNRVLTMLGVVPEWIRLLLLPIRLKVEYLPQEVRLADSFGWPQAGGGVLLLGVAVAAARFRRTRPEVTFAVLWTAVALLPVSNLLVPSGVLLAERTLFLPSVGAALAMGAGAAWIAKRAASWSGAARRAVAGLGAVILMAGIARSAVRAPVWRNNRSFFDQMLVDSPRSYRSHWVHALRLFDARDTEGGDREFATALALFPDDPELLAQVGDRYLASKRCAEAVRLYRRSMELHPGERYFGTRIVRCLVELGRLEEARQELSRELAAGEPDAHSDSVRLDSILRVRRR